MVGPFFFLLALGVAPATAATPAFPARTSDSVDQFRTCFASAAAGPWWFVPDETGGGIFSNEGAPAVSDAFRIEYRADHGQYTLRLLRKPGSKLRRVAAIVRHCSTVHRLSKQQFAEQDQRVGARTSR